MLLQMRTLPAGTVTFLFTDIEGSTRLLHELGPEGYAAALAEHRRVLRQAFAAHGGVEVDTQGDAFFVAFPTAPGALATATEAQAALELPVRMGVHTGTPLLAGEGYVGMDLNRAARIAAAGSGGQVLVSASTQALADGFELRDLGEHRMKDLGAAERVFQLGTADFPPLKTLYQTNLPVPATPFLGRARELAEVVESLTREEVRLLTLTGPGGTGKTRLALQAAGAAAERYPHGVWWAPLATVVETTSVLDAAGRALGVAGAPAPAIADRRLLLVLDNFEHVVEAARDLAALLAECPNLDLLVTSRERLGIAGEYVYPVPVLARAEARTLFTARARALRPDFEPDGAVDELCERLDDLPLALELAAARVVLLTTEQLLERLGRRLDLLRGGRDADARQQTLRATIEWSYELLEPAEQQLFARLAVFAGGCTLTAAEEICGAELDTLQSLVEKSLLRVRGGGRFWMLETIRHYSLERLAESGEAEAMRRRHGRFFLELAESANLAAERITEQRFDLVLPDQDNARAALDWALTADPVLGLRLAVALEHFWVSYGAIEGVDRTQALLDCVETPELRARALRAVGSSADQAGRGQLAEACYEESLRAYRKLGDDWGVAHLLMRLAHSAHSRGAGNEARELAAASLEISRRRGFATEEIQVLTLEGTLMCEGGDDVRGTMLLEESARRAGEIGFIWWQVVALQRLVEHLLSRGRGDDAESHARQALRLVGRIGDAPRRVYLIALLARAAALRRDAERAGRLWGALEAEVARKPLPWNPFDSVHAERVLALEGPDFDRARSEGSQQTLDEAVAYALSVD